MSPYPASLGRPRPRRSDPTWPVRRALTPRGMPDEPSTTPDLHCLKTLGWPLSDHLRVPIGCRPASRAEQWPGPKRALRQSTPDPFDFLRRTLGTLLLIGISGHNQECPLIRLRMSHLRLPTPLISCDPFDFLYAFNDPYLLGFTTSRFGCRRGRPNALYAQQSLLCPNDPIPL
jgi:hypothetical protein